MRSSLSPSEVFNRRLAILKALLGPGWLASAWTDDPGNMGLATGPDRVRAEDWAAMERCYGQLVHHLLPGLDYLCQLRTRATVGRNSLEVGGNPSQGGADGATALDGAIDCALVDPSLSTRDTPVALMHALRKGMTVSPAGITTSCSITAGDLLHGIVPFLAWLYCLHGQRAASPERSARCLVLLAAIPGAGKSVIVNVLEQFSRLLKDYPSVQSIGMDGWHLPNHVMQSRRTTDESGRIVPLATRKGSPESFDVKQLTCDIQALVSDPSPARMPVYDRTLHEPVSQAVLIGAPIVLLEGNYLLLGGQGWERVGDLACGAAWLDVSIDLARRSMLDRHMVSGRSLQEAEMKWVSNDGPNALASLRSRGHADVVLHMDASRRMHFMHRP